MVNDEPGMNPNLDPEAGLDPELFPTSDRIILELQDENANLRALLTKASHRLDAVWCVGKFVGADADVFVEIAAALKR